MATESPNPLKARFSWVESSAMKGRMTGLGNLEIRKRQAAGADLPRGRRGAEWTNVSEGAASGPVTPVRIGGLRGAVSILVATCDGLCKHLKGLGFTGQLITGEIRVMPSVELHPDGQVVWVARGQIFLGCQQRGAMLREQAAQNGWRVLPWRFQQFYASAAEIAFGKVEGNAMAAQHRIASVFASEPLILALKQGLVRAGADGKKEILITRAWLAVQRAAKQVQTVLKGIEGRDPRRVGPQCFNDHQPVGGVPKNRESHVSRIDVSVIQHREGVFPCTLIELSEYHFGGVHAVLRNQIRVTKQEDA
jgi:hypothetical protein